MSEMTLVYAQEHISEQDPPGIFLAGPTPREDTPLPYRISWRIEAIESFRSQGYLGALYVPEPRKGATWKHYDGQIWWEKKAMRRAAVILFWVPRVFPVLPGLTTNIEWGYWTAKDPGKLVIGYPVGADKVGYLAHDMSEYKIPFEHDMGQLVRLAIIKYREREHG